MSAGALNLTTSGVEVGDARDAAASPGKFFFWQI